MNRAQSKYFNTAVRMDQAFLGLLERKDLKYITVKEICAAAGVNRSTFYLHYETIADLLAESMQYIIDEFLAHMKVQADVVVSRIKTCPLDELYLVTPAYLTPYLEYVVQHKRLFRTAVENSEALRLDRVYQRMFRHVFSPILERFQIPAEDREYMMAFYVQGLMAIVSQWLREDCADSISHVRAVMEQCVMGGRKKGGKQ